MLYSNRNEPLSPELFLNPTSEYRAAPFWAWNCKLDSDDLTWQIEQLKKMGFGGFHMHVRTGMATEYLSDEYMELVGSCVDKARTEHMLAWLYDEDRYPSGAAGGYVTKNAQYRARHLLLTRNPYKPVTAACGDDGVASGFTDASGKARRAENGRLLACFDVYLNDRGELVRYERINEADSPSGFILYAYEEVALPNSWFNNQTYVNTLDPAAIAEFIKITYERYNDFLARDFGGIVPAIFTDEPQFTHKQTLAYAHEEKDVVLPWTDDLPETYRSKHGDDICEKLPELLWDLKDGKTSVARYNYHDHVAERFAAAFADQCGKWCEAHGLMLTGHMMEEPTLRSQTAALGDAMRSYRSFQLPGIDMLCDFREFTTAKQAQSAARQYGRPGVMSELYGVTNWDFDFRGHKLQGDWQAALGVTVRVPHLSWVSMKGGAKRDYPATFNYQAPWYEEYPFIEDHFARLNTALTRGAPVCRVGVIHPIESYWLHWGVEETTAAIRGQMERNFRNLTEWLLRGCIDFDFICESLLPDLCDCATISGDGFPVGEMRYDVVIVPAPETIRTSTLERLEAFVGAGGRVIFLGDAPPLADALPDKRGAALWSRCERILFDQFSILCSLSDLQDVEIRGSSGALTDSLIYQMRDEDCCRWLFVAHADAPVNCDIPQGELLRISVRGIYSVEIYDTMTGNIRQLQAGHTAGQTMIQLPFYEHDSVLLRLNKLATATAIATAIVEESRAVPSLADGNTEVRALFLEPVSVTLDEPNVLLLDMAEFSLDGQAYRPKEEILRLDNILRKELKWPLRSDLVAQPWVEHDSSTPHTIRLRYTFQSEIAVCDACIALEDASTTDIVMNGQPVSNSNARGGSGAGGGAIAGGGSGAGDGASAAHGGTDAGGGASWYVDKSIEKVALPPIRQGENVIELSMPYGRKSNVEACYLLGDFGVRVEGCVSVLTRPVKTLCFGDITRQGLPFYGGNLTYHLEAYVENGEIAITASNYRGHLLRVAVDNKDAGVIAFSPYMLRVANLTPGKHKIDLKYFGSRVNTFGQLHRVDRYYPWWGPESWRTTGAAWSYEYRFWPQGVLSSPLIEV